MNKSGDKQPPSTEPCTDLVSRQAVLDLLVGARQNTSGFEFLNKTLYELFNTVQFELPPATHGAEWRDISSAPKDGNREAKLDNLRCRSPIRWDDVMRKAAEGTHGSWYPALVKARDKAGFHWKHDVFFRREKKRVIVTVFGDYNGPTFEQWCIPLNEWQSIVDAMASPTPPPSLSASGSEVLGAVLTIDMSSLPSDTQTAGGEV